MRIEIKPDGTTVLETNGSSAADIAALIRELQRKNDDALDDRPASLNDIQGATYDWMVLHDKDQGIHISAIARAFGISNGAAGQRCYQLVKDGFATKICNGRYRPVVEA